MRICTHAQGVKVVNCLDAGSASAVKVVNFLDAHSTKAGYGFLSPLQRTWFWDLRQCWQRKICPMHQFVPTCQQLDTTRLPAAVGIQAFSRCHNWNTFWSAFGKKKHTTRLLGKAEFDNLWPLASLNDYLTFGRSFRSSRMQRCCGQQSAWHSSGSWQWGNLLHHLVPRSISMSISL
jgi:hypothetical protein